MRRILASLAIASLLAAPMSVAAAEPGLSIEVGPAHLVGKVVVEVDATFTCDPLTFEPPISATWSGGWAWVDLKQAVGRQQVSAWGDVYFEPEEYCDGLPHTVQVALAGEGAYHFKSGWAAIRAGVSVEYETYNEETWESDWVSVGAQTGWMEVRISR